MSTLPLHPLQSKEWGEFRTKTGIEVIGVAPGFIMTIHPLPKLPWTIGYLPKCSMPTEQILEKLRKIAKDKKCIFIKLEPNVISSPTLNSELLTLNLKSSPHPLFTKFSFQLDLTQSDDELMKHMKPKTRYNIRIAQKNDVVVREETSEEAFNTYLKLSRETWDRQKFYGHTEHYHRLMWETLHPSGIAHLLIAYYSPRDNENGQSKIDNKETKIEDRRQKSNIDFPTSSIYSQSSNLDLPLAAWIVFLYKGVLYYPYGASSTQYKEVMASNLMMWVAIKWGKKHGAKLFDMWGSLGPEPDTRDPWYGFHRFKEGYGGNLVEFIGSYDLVLQPSLYHIYSFLQPARQQLLKLIR